MISNSEISNIALNSLKGNWLISIAVMFLFCIIACAVCYIPFAGLFIYGPLTVGACIFFMALVSGGQVSPSMLLDGFRIFGTSFIAYLMVAIFTFLWTLLLIIPGIIAALNYSQTFYILATDSTINPMEAIRISKEMMYGHRWQLCYLQMRFFFLSLLCILTLGIGYIWLGPYMNACLAAFYIAVSTANRDTNTSGPLPYNYE